MTLDEEDKAWIEELMRRLLRIPDQPLPKQAAPGSFAARRQAALDQLKLKKGRAGT